jgi:hypothetical protein
LLCPGPWGASSPTKTATGVPLGRFRRRLRALFRKIAVGLGDVSRHFHWLWPFISIWPENPAAKSAFPVSSGEHPHAGRTEVGRVPQRWRAINPCDRSELRGGFARFGLAQRGAGANADTDCSDVHLAVRPCRPFQRKALGDPFYRYYARSSERAAAERDPCLASRSSRSDALRRPGRRGR